MARARTPPPVVQHRDPSRPVVLVQLLHTVVVIYVVTAATLLAAWDPKAVGSDTAGVVYGAAISYAAGALGQARGILQRRGDSSAGTVAGARADDPL